MNRTLFLKKFSSEILHAADADGKNPQRCFGSKLTCYYPYGESNIDIGKEDAEVGYWIGRPYWNQGYCTEALYAMIGYCFNVKRFQTLWADYFIDNPASGRVMDKCGFTDTGKKNYCSRLLHGDDKPICVMRLDYSAYRP